MNKALLLTFGPGGHTLHGTTDRGNKVTSQGYSTPEQFVRPYHWWADPDEVMSVAWNDWGTSHCGAPVVDVTPAIATAAGRLWAIRGPIPAIGEPPSKCPSLDGRLVVGAVASTSALAATLFAIQKTHDGSNQPGPLDSVSLDEYVEGWRAVGARIGRVYITPEEILLTWDDGESMTAQHP